MKCENSFCIYQSEGECILEEISIDAVGMCNECIRPELKKSILISAKERLLKKYEKTDRSLSE